MPEHEVTWAEHGERLARRLDMLEHLWRGWADAGALLAGSPGLLTRPTRLPGWTVADLYAHAATWPHAFAALLDRPAPPSPGLAGPVVTAPALLRLWNEPGGLAHVGAAQVAEFARQVARRPFDEIRAAFTDVAAAGLALARARGPEVVDYVGAAWLPLADVAWIGVLEATVHLLDLADAVAGDRDASGGTGGSEGSGGSDGSDGSGGFRSSRNPAVALPSDAALAETRDLLVAIPPAIDLVEAATGRTRATLFPVLR